ncbi:hypothetical protein PPERSA_12320 [Pseudocohnilembus persalinus]|uniref:Insulin-like growth factor binding protein, N-terminal n=1 Tax=Pseudocohnilembus persalinus TaxID=266149 RepID=A0A0V0R9E2_PSEPJ|nr:hypothetical protein PPERSA_12320 [Pseudocohnilembus persalinus]|eukprot:KRX10992.1 hypothetical protein PPERSA_12320 [Pseudocohnilembus persalinus]
MIMMYFLHFQMKVAISVEGFQHQYKASYFIINQKQGKDVWDQPKDKGIFLNLVNDYNRIQNKAIQIENTNKYSIVTGDRLQDIFTIYTFQYNGNGIIQDICFKTYSNQFGNGESKFFFALEFGVINQDFMWIKGDDQNQNQKTVIFFANPQDCQVYKNSDNKSIYQYQLKHFGRSHVFHTYQSNRTVSLITSTSYTDGSYGQNLQAIRITLGDCHDNCKTCYDYDTCLSCYGDMSLNQQNKCQCQKNSIQTFGYKGQCKVCQNFQLNNTFEGYWSSGNCYENYYSPDIIQYVVSNCKIKLNSDYFYCRDQSDFNKITSLKKGGEFISCYQDCFPSLTGIEPILTYSGDKCLTIRLKGFN